MVYTKTIIHLSVGESGVYLGQEDSIFTYATAFLCSTLTSGLKKERQRQFSLPVRLDNHNIYRSIAITVITGLVIN